ncbi:MAG: hypothetical protein HY918_05060 [Candidatus Doudnabacteria bacterium]|nr:hypothetical protein [Candidatus Doudnabacteria bacterium]
MKRLLPLIGFIFLGLYFLSCAATPTAWHFIDNVNLIFHEAGHWIFSLFGIFMEVLGGSLNQVLIPLLIAGYFLKNKQLVSACVVLMWSGQSLINVSVYAGDALKMQLPLLGGDASVHDWNWLLIYTGQLRHAAGISQSINALGWLLLLLGLLFGIYFILKVEDSESKTVLPPNHTLV